MTIVEQPPPAASAARPTKLAVRDLYKVFGPNPDRAVALLEAGASKRAVQDELGLAVGVADVSLDIKAGETFVLMGLSGSGKSTLLRLLNRLHEPTSGSITVDDVEITGLSRNELLRVRREKFSGMVFQQFAVLPHRTVAANVAYGLEVQGVREAERRERSLAAIELVGLSGWESHYPHQLSGGMQQRVGLARALAVDADILLMDEAFSALDPLIRREMQDELIDLQARMRKTIVFVTHDLDEALKLGDRIALMKDGAIVQIGTPEEILTNPENAYVEKFVADVDLTRVLSASDVMRHPEPVAQCTAGPRVALHLMEEHDIPGIFVVTRQRLLRGRVTLDDAVEAVKKGKAMAEILITDIPVVAPDASLSDIISLIVGSPYPVAVADDTGRLKGVISRGAILAALARKGEDINATA